MKFEKGQLYEVTAWAYYHNIEGMLCRYIGNQVNEWNDSYEVFKLENPDGEIENELYITQHGWDSGDCRVKPILNYEVIIAEHYDI